MTKQSETGKWGENQAVNLLTSKGYAIRETNWRMPPYEIDIIAMKGNRIIFVEVKTRSTDFIDPITAINKKKQSNMIKAANAYINIFNLPHEVQFDVILIVNKPGGEVEIDHIEDAFYPSIRRF